MDIYAEIKSDHRAVKKLLDELVDTTEDAVPIRKQLFSKIKDELSAHNEAEEDLFYSKLNASRIGRVLAHEGRYEHQVGSQLLDELETLDIASEEWTAKAKVLKDVVEHHIKEEEGEIHPEAKKQITEEEARRLGDAFVKMKDELKALNHVA